MTIKATKATKHGVTDWPKKRFLCLKLIGFDAFGDVVEEVIKSTQEYTDDSTLLERITEAARKWGNSDPTSKSSKFFWNQLAYELDCPMATGDMLIVADIKTFVSYLSTEGQQRAQQIIDHNPLYPSSSKEENPNPSDIPEAQLSPHEGAPYPISTHDIGRVESIRTGFQRGKIDQKHYYVDPDSAHAWSGIVGAEAYPTYDDCKSGLRELVKSAEWNQSITSSAPSTVVMLTGGGAPTKDLVILQSLLDQPNAKHIYYYLADISFYMLMNSKFALEEHAKSRGFEGRFTLDLIRRDVVNMPSDDREKFHRCGSVIFAITGGTIGNLSEAAFFRSLNRVAKSGDLLVVSADTIDGLSVADQEELIGKYDNQDLRLWLKPVVRVVLSESSEGGSLDDALRKIKVRLHSSDSGHTSDVPNSCSVVVTLKIEGREVKLLTSTRYPSSELAAFAAARGWEAVCKIPSPLNRHFNQFLFRRNAVETSGI
jgi:hypothetical protein